MIEKLSLVDEKMKPRGHIKSYEEVYSYINSNLKKMHKQSGESFIEYMSRKLDYVYQAVVKELENAYEVFKSVAEAHTFYKELFKLYVGVDPQDLMLKAKAYIRVARSIYKQAHADISKLDKSSSSRAPIIFKMSAGRLLSLYKRIVNKAQNSEQYFREVAKMPDVSGDYVAVIAGLPQVGKSTLLSNLTRAKPEIGSYPFTTKTIIAGHIDVNNYGKIVLVDSPGILDSPIEEKNLIELKAILALKHLADHVIYVFAVYPHFYYTLEEQLRVYESVVKLLGGKPVTVILNKVDLLEKEHVEAVLGKIETKVGVKPIPVSALMGYNLDLVKKQLVDAFMAKTQRPR